MACVSWFWNVTVFYTEITAAALSVVGVLLATSRFHAHVATAVKSAQTVFSGDQYRVFQEFALPVAVVGTAGDIIWYNQPFWDSVCEKRECRGDNILKFLGIHSVDEVLNSDGLEIPVGHRKFAVYGARTASGSLFYFVENTYFREIEKKYRESRQTVIFAYFDNREEFARSVNSSEDTRIASKVEEILIQWAQSMDGFLKKLSSGRFIILTDEFHVRQEMEKRFPVLDKIRAIRVGEHLSATVSMGVARGASTPQDADLWARNALDMALGRGGDQVAVKQKNDTY